MKVILASGSPRRRQLIGEIFEKFDVMPQDVEEKCSYRRADMIVTYLAKLKLGNLPQRYSDALIISADTVVYMDGKVYGKPCDEAQAKSFLKELSGRRHFVYTGVALCWNGKVYTFYDKSSVKFKDLDESEIAAYIAGGSPMDKAGAYGIQDKEVVESFEGSYTNIVGLPMEKLRENLKTVLQNRTE